VLVESLKQTPLEDQRVEIVERKGRGHPDSMCDAIAEAVSLALCREYLAAFGCVLHHNVDKALLVAGQTEPRLGGGVVLEPMRLVLGDRAVAEYRGKRVPVGEIAEASAKSWLRSNLRFVDPDRHLVFQNELKPGSPELRDIFERTVIGANDTSAAVGYAPLTETERLVLAAEQYLNSPAFKEEFPEAGEDVKVMGIRRDRELLLIVALAFVDRFVADSRSYFSRKEEIRGRVTAFLQGKLHHLDHVVVQMNALDDPGRGEGGMYLSVLGTSAEGGDCGQVGRGNRVNGVIPLNRPTSAEAAAGKNPVSHVGKIYSLLSHRMAETVVEHVPEVREAYVWLCSQIGQPVRSPRITAAQLILRDGASIAAIRPAVENLLERELASIEEFSQRLVRGELAVW
jgi:S-adenosylmethionine synthetase